ncbi:MAG: hypothetical protein ACRCZF_22775, partial [Gemmataceae bacterium]
DCRERLVQRGLTHLAVARCGWSAADALPLLLEETITELDLSENPLHQLPAQSFPPRKQLNLARCGLEAGPVPRAGRLNLRGNHFTTETLRELNLDEVDELDLTGNHLAAWSVGRRCPRLLNLSANFLEDSALATLELSGCEELNLSWNPLSADAVRQLAARVQTRIIHLVE